MADAVKRCVSQPFSNLNEADISKWKDQKTGDVIVLPERMCLIIRQDLNRDVTYLLRHCDAARFSATPGTLERVDRRLCNSCVLKRSEKPYVDSGLCVEYVKWCSSIISLMCGFSHNSIARNSSC
jgi:hypothetical protein